jgi:DNA-binding NtrC family response regulator
MSNIGTILVVDDDDDILTAARLLLRRRFAEVITCRRPERIPDLMERHAFDVVLLDMNFGPGESSGKQGLEWLESILRIDPDVVVIMITAHGSVDNAVEAMKLGATDFVTKPWQNEKVVATVSTGVELRRSRSETATLRRANEALRQASGAVSPDIIAESAAMQEVFSIVERAAPTMGAISESLFESELFGHRKGAFTGANEDRLGRFQAADGGTLFLDEIGNLPLHLQAKLLSALEQREVTPVGADRPQSFDIRVVAATNTPIEHLRDADLFRPDLLFRLNTVEITIPPLRERKDDILPIARHYAAVYARKYGKLARTFSLPAESALLDYDWPGNVRALSHAIERAVILTSGKQIEPIDLQLDYPGEAAAPATTTAIPTILNLDDMEKATIERALLKHGFNISRAAAELGLTRASLYRRMEKHGI